MKIAVLAIATAAIAVNGVDTETCQPCHHTCEVKGDPHILSFTKQNYKLDPKKGWNNLFSDGKNSIKAKITGDKWQYMEEADVFGKKVSTRQCTHDGHVIHDSSKGGTKAKFTCKKTPQYRRSDSDEDNKKKNKRLRDKSDSKDHKNSDSSKWHLDGKIERKIHTGKGAEKKNNARKLSETGACTHGKEKMSFKCGCGGDKPKHPHHHHKPNHKPTVKPTDKPHHEPNHKPTVKPTDKPHHKPNHKPTPNPTNKPVTHKPTTDKQKPSGDSTCKKVLKETCGDRPAKCQAGEMEGADKSKCDAYRKCVAKNQAKLPKKCQKVPKKPDHKPSHEPTPNPTNKPVTHKPTTDKRKPSGDSTCEQVLKEKCGDRPAECQADEMEDADKSKCDAYDECVAENKAKMPKKCHELELFGGECTCTARCIAKADPHIISFGGKRWKTEAGGSSITLFAKDDFSIEASVNDFDKNKEYITEVFHNKESILNIKDCDKGTKPVSYEETFDNGTLVQGTVTCKRSPNTDTWYLDVELNYHFAIASSNMKQGEAKGYAALYKDAIGGEGECTAEDEEKPNKSNVRCTC